MEEMGEVVMNELEPPTKKKEKVTKEKSLKVKKKKKATVTKVSQLSLKRGPLEALPPSPEEKKGTLEAKRLNSVDSETHRISTRASSTIESEAAADAEAQREAFYKEMKDIAPETFNYLLDFYLEQGHSEEHAKYFAGYYTALKVHNEETNGQT